MRIVDVTDLADLFEGVALPGWRPVPAELEPEVERLLAGRTDAEIDVPRGSALARWAREQENPS